MIFTKVIFMTFLTAKFIFASHQEHLSQETSVSTQSYRRIDFSHRIWNLISSQNTEEVSIAKNTPNLGIVECGVACHKKSECGGILYDNSSRSCVMKSVTRRRLSLNLQYLIVLSLRVWATSPSPLSLRTL